VNLAGIQEENTMQKIITYISRDDFEDRIDRIAKPICWVILILAAIYFAPPVIKAFWG
jgi:hypothetical protein